MKAAADGSYGAFYARIRGIVQGVGFRYAARQEARRLGLSGWVRNDTDGSVELVAEGPLGALKAFESWLCGGPPGSVVQEVAKQNRKPTGSFSLFTIEP
jgi:acylphosphatase